MASFFGEVRPFSSRAVDDEEADNQPKYKIEFSKSENIPLSSVNLIIFSVGEIASIFAKSYFLPDNFTCIGSIKYSFDKDDDDDEESTLYTSIKSKKNPKNVIASSLFMSKPEVLICEISKSVPDEICYEITETVFHNYFPSNVLVLTSEHVATFKSVNFAAFEMPFLKSLGTTQYLAANACKIPHLDPPNFLSNMPASILLKCEVAKVPALCIINYIDVDVIDSLNVQVFDKVLNEAVVSQITANPNAEARVIQYVKAKQSIESNLYT